MNSRFGETTRYELKTQLEEFGTYLVHQKTAVVATAISDDTQCRRTLLDRCERACLDQTVPYARVTLRRKRDPHCFLDHLTYQLGEEMFPIYTSTSRDASIHGPRAIIRNSVMILSSSRAVLAGRSEDAFHRRLMMDFASDLRKCGKRSALLIDHFGSGDAKILTKWIGSEFLPILSMSMTATAVIAGESLPPLNDYSTTAHTANWRLPVMNPEVVVDEWMQSFANSGIPVERKSLEKLVSLNVNPGLLGTALETLLIKGERDDSE